MRCDEAIVSLLKTPEKIVIGSRKIEIKIGGSDNRNFAHLCPWYMYLFLKIKTVQYANHKHLLKRRVLTQEVPSKNFSPIGLQFSGRVQTVEQKFLNFEIIFFLCALSSFR